MNDEHVTRPISEGEPVAEAVVIAVSEAIGTGLPEHGAALDEIEQLYDAVDPDALESLFRSPGDGSAREGTVTFVYGGCEVSVVDGRRVLVHPLD